MAEPLKCPHCGARVYATDQECMACGKSLRELPGASPAPPAQTETPVPQVAPAYETPRAAVRPPVQMSTPQRIANAFGGFWDLYPWLFLGLGVVTGLVMFSGAPATVFLAMSLLVAVLWLGVIFWMVVDVFAMESEIWWLILFFFFPLLGLILYLIIGRS